ncbi:MAG TPA: hypothetical protein VFR34_05120 [Paracoccaceae bacterium]|nr:hypothetical protein [Paracoccaceae bacterium]
MTRFFGFDQDECIETSALIGHARMVYRGLSEALAEAISTLRQGEDRSADAKGRLELIKSHYKALQTVIEIEVGLGKRNKGGDGSGAAELDLAAARDEIHRRISLLRAEGGD